MKLDEAPENARYVLRKVDGTGTFCDRARSIGLVEGTTLKVVRNEPKMPILIYVRDTLLAVNRKDAAHTAVVPVHEEA